MLKKIEILVFSFLITALGVIIVKAATQTIFKDDNYSIGSGTAVGIVNKNASYNNLVAILDVNVMTSGEAKTKFVAYKRQLVSLVLKAEKVTGIKEYTCQYLDVGNVGKGSWSVTNRSYDGDVDFAGWSGALTYNSVS